MATRVLKTLNQILPELRYEPTAKWIRAFSKGSPVLDTKEAVLLWEPMRATPIYAVPSSDVLAELLKSSAQPQPVVGARMLFPDDAFLMHTANGTIWDVRVADQVLEGAAFSFTDPELADYVEFDFQAFDWFEEEELLFAHARDAFHRIDVRSSTRHVRVELNGVLLAETPTPEVLFETMLPPRYYLPHDSVVWDQLQPTASSSMCPYKGKANCWKARDTETEVAWSYAEPVRGMERLAGLVCFYNERVDLLIDGVVAPRPQTPFGQLAHGRFRPIRARTSERDTYKERS